MADKTEIINNLIIIGYKRQSAEDIYFRYSELQALETLITKIEYALEEVKQNALSECGAV